MPSHAIVAQGLEALRNLDHRGATGSDPKTGDGAGILMQIPDAFLRAEVDFELPRQGAYAVGNAFLPTDRRRRGQGQGDHRADRRRGAPDGARLARGAHRRRLAERPDPVEHAATSSSCSWPPAARRCTGIALDRLAYCLRRRAQHEVGVYFASLSARTLVYKGMLTTEQLELVFPELLDERMASALAVVHSRFSTNTFPAWELAHPFRMIAHNGEINTVKGNRNWMRAREALLASDVHPRRPGPAVPDLHPGRLRLRLLRRGGGAAAPGRPLAAARDADDDPGGVGEQRPDGPASARTSTPSTPA